MSACGYCGCDVFDHDPVIVDEVDDGERVEAGASCNYACLSAYVEEVGLTADAACEIGG